MVCGLLALIYIGSTTAFSALVSLPLISLYLSYLIPIFFLLTRKVRGQQLPYGPFKLGRWGIAVNLFAIVYILYVVSFMPLPTILPVTSLNMNYAGPLVLAIIVLALIDWTFSGRFRFQIPVLKMDT